MFHFASFPPFRLCIQRKVFDVSSKGFPHSDTPGLQVACHLPEIIAGCGVLHRLLHAKPSTVRPYVLRPSGSPIRMRESETDDGI